MHLASRAVGLHYLHGYLSSTGALMGSCTVLSHGAISIAIVYIAPSGTDRPASFRGPGLLRVHQVDG